MQGPGCRLWHGNQGLGFRALRFGVWGLRFGFGVWCLGCGVKGAGSRVQWLGLRV